MSPDTGWQVVLGSALGCYALKLAGYLLPQRWFDPQWLRTVLRALPVALLTALIVVQTIAAGTAYSLDGPRLAGVGVAGIALWRRAPFLVVVIAAAATAALLRLA
jgi:branched-subunit amino acid transport protein